MLELKNISYIVNEDGKEKAILKDINLTVDEHFVAITGPNGGGSVIDQYLPNFNEPGTVKDAEVEMIAATVLKNTQHAGVLRNIKIA